MRIDNRVNVRTALITGCAAIAMIGGTPVAAAPPKPGQSTPLHFNISSGELGTALTQLGRTAGVQIVFLPDRVRGRKAKALRGTYTIEDALTRLLDGTGLRFQRTNKGTYVVGGPTVEAVAKAETLLDDLNAANGRTPDGKEAVPEILVIGKRNWTLNLDIQRTADDAQPYVVFSREEIARSGTTNLEDFFKNFLNASASGSTSTQNGGNSSQSFINLRGLGAENTLILIDGRRPAEANTGMGSFGQASINGIPLDAVERIEVLPSSASGIYGSAAVGGVINIIMRHDYRGLEANFYYGNTNRLDSFENRASINGSFPLEHGKTRLSFTASWRKTGGLYQGDRDFLARGRAELLQVAPGYFETLTTPILGATPNIISADGNPLVLKPQYGGTSLGSRITYLPSGFRGISIDGVAALIANAGKQNLALSPVVDTNYQGGGGAYTRLLGANQNYNASATVKRKFANWLDLYIEGDYSRYEYFSDSNPASGIYSVPAAAPDNPFTRTIQVSLPIYAGTRTNTNVSTTWRLLTGGIVKLPFKWNAAVDLVWNWSTFRSAASFPAFDVATYQRQLAGTLGLLRDPMLGSFDFNYLDMPSNGKPQPSKGFSRTYTVKLAGPLPWIRVWGGKPIATIQAQRDQQTQGEFVSYSNYPSISSITYTPPRSNRDDSVYGEINFPVVAERNHVPLMRELQLQVAARYDHYVGVGANKGLSCLNSMNGPLPADAYTLPCPQHGQTAVYATTRNSSINPTVALRWAVSKDIAFRGSYSTGYLPPYLYLIAPSDPQSAISALSGKVISYVRDPQRGGEPIGSSYLGVFNILSAKTGGNPNLDPQTSESWSFGAILTPQIVSGLRLSVDWSRITQNNIYYIPSLILASSSPGGQTVFEQFLAAHPERFTRDTNPATFGSFGVGPIISADLTTVNIARMRSEALDFTASYDHSLGNGQIDVTGSATKVLDLNSQFTKASKPVNYTGVADNSFLVFTATAGGVEWKGNLSATYTAKRWSFGARVRYVGPYWLNTDHSVQSLQGSARIGAQAYVDIFGSFNLARSTQLRGGVNNVFDRMPPLNLTSGYFYSMFGDPKGANFYLSINRRF